MVRVKGTLCTQARQLPVQISSQFIILLKVSNAFFSRFEQRLLTGIEGQSEMKTISRKALVHAIMTVNMKQLRNILEKLQADKVGPRCVKIPRGHGREQMCRPFCITL